MIRPARTTSLAGDSLRLQHASRVFELGPVELATLSFLLAAELDPQDEPSRRSLRVADVVAALEGAHDRMDVLAALSSIGSLMQHELIG